MASDPKMDFILKEREGIALFKGFMDVFKQANRKITNLTKNTAMLVVCHSKAAFTKGRPLYKVFLCRCLTEFEEDKELQDWEPIYNNSARLTLSTVEEILKECDCVIVSCDNQESLEFETTNLKGSIANILAKVHVACLRIPKELYLAKDAKSNETITQKLHENLGIPYKSYSERFKDKVRKMASKRRGHN